MADPWVNTDGGEMLSASLGCTEWTFETPEITTRPTQRGWKLSDGSQSTQGSTQRKESCAGLISDWYIWSSSTPTIACFKSERLGYALACALFYSRWFWSDLSRKVQNPAHNYSSLKSFFFQAHEQADVKKRKTAVLKLIPVAQKLERVSLSIYPPLNVTML